MPDFLQQYEDCSGMLEKVAGDQGDQEFLFVKGGSLFWFKSLLNRAPTLYLWEQRIFADGAA